LLLRPWRAQQPFRLKIYESSDAGLNKRLSFRYFENLIWIASSRNADVDAENLAAATTNIRFLTLRHGMQFKSALLPHLLHLHTFQP
jgi:hypothetical protein